MDPVIDKLFEDMFGGILTTGFDSWEEDGLLFLRLDVPGYDKENISVTAENGSILVEASREEKKREYLVHTRLDKFRKVIRVPLVWSLEKIDATYENGVLTMSVEKDKKKTRKVQIK